MDDLFGKTIILFNGDTGEHVATKRSPELPRRADREKGFWLARTGPRNRHVSAILLVNSVGPISVVNLEQTLVLWHNPWAIRPLDSEMWVGPEWVFDGTAKALVYQEGKTIRQIFGRN